MVSTGETATENTFVCAKGYYGESVTCNKTTNTFSATPKCTMCKRPKDTPSDIVFTSIENGHKGEVFKFKLTKKGGKDVSDIFTCDNETGELLDDYGGTFDDLLTAIEQELPTCPDPCEPLTKSRERISKSGITCRDSNEMIRTCKKKYVIDDTIVSDNRYGKVEE
jgi:hypothetical protein